MKSVSRRTFLKTTGVAAGAAAISAAPALGVAAEPVALETTPSSPVQGEAVVAVLRDVDLDQVTVFVGQTEHTYRDRPLARRLLKAAARNAAGREGVA